MRINSYGGFFIYIKGLKMELDHDLSYERIMFTDGKVKTMPLSGTFETENCGATVTYEIESKEHIKLKIGSSGQCFEIEDLKELIVFLWEAKNHLEEKQTFAHNLGKK